MSRIILENTTTAPESIPSGCFDIRFHNNVPMWYTSTLAANRFCTEAATSKPLSERLIEPVGAAAITDHFRRGVLPAGFAWASAPFIAPSTMTLNHQNDYLRASDSGGGRGFLCQTITTYVNKSLYGRVAPGNTGRIGLRIDDGTDSNYVEVRLDQILAGQMSLIFASRVSGGSVAQATIVTTLVQFLTLQLLFSGGRIYASIVPEHAETAMLSNTTIAWTPARAGIIIIGNGTGFADWIYSEFA